MCVRVSVLCVYDLYMYECMCERENLCHVFECMCVCVYACDHDNSICFWTRIHGHRCVRECLCVSVYTRLALYTCEHSDAIDTHMCVCVK
jgi:hypothetical protein